jgi:glyoxylase-like metal-dependent hydrolase (beta-lactamase superfamily II)
MERWLTPGGCTVYSITKGRSNTYLVLTHSHYDHAENTAVVKEWYPTRVIIYKSDHMT